MAGKRGKWEYRDHWIDNNVAGSDQFYVYWYEYAGLERKRKVCRRSLKTRSFEEAQDRLIEFVMARDTESDDALVVSILERYCREVTTHLPSAEAADRARELLIEVLDGHERVYDLTTKFQRDFILKIWRERYGHSVGYMSRNMSVLAAAIAHCGVKDAPRIYYNKNWIAEKLSAPAPVAGKWIPKDDELARFIDHIQSDHTFHWMIIALNTACRPEAAIDLGPDQIDLDARLVHLNPEGRPQDPRKYRPDIRLTENLAAWAEVMPVCVQDVKTEEEREELEKRQPWKLGKRYVPYRSIDSLQSVFARTRIRKGVNLPKLVPYSIRHKMTTVLRIKQVPEDQVSMLLGHRRPEFRTTRLYGEYDPAYLRDAASAIDEFMWELNKRTDRSLLPSSASMAASGDNVVRLTGARRTS